ncbi:MAG: hypothetical protein KC478_06155 [Bacteriovoracaceae bacterium]|nr:hypothetical protein [Bacteriovoracaceae bacterium]
MKLLLVALLVGSSAFANMVPTAEKTVTKKFRMDSRTDFGARVYYNCDSVEIRGEELLEELGATNILVDCSGGLDPVTRWPMDAYVEATFTVKVEDANGQGTGMYEDFLFRSHTSCDLYKSFFDHVKDEFEFAELDRVRSCSSSSRMNRIKISGTVLR